MQSGECIVGQKRPARKYPQVPHASADNPSSILGLMFARIFSTARGFLSTTPESEKDFNLQVAAKYTIPSECFSSAQSMLSCDTNID
jgi:hypothetical protein